MKPHFERWPKWLVRKGPARRVAIAYLLAVEFVVVVIPGLWGGWRQFQKLKREADALEKSGEFARQARLN